MTTANSAILYAHPSGTITPRLTPGGVEAYCTELARRAPTLEKRVAAIDELYIHPDR